MFCCGFYGWFLSYFDLFSRLVAVFTMKQLANQVKHEKYTRYIFSFFNFGELFSFKIQRRASNPIQSYPMTWGAVLVNAVWMFLPPKPPKIGLGRWDQKTGATNWSKHLGQSRRIPKSKNSYNLNSKRSCCPYAEKKTFFFSPGFHLVPIQFTHFLE